MPAESLLEFRRNREFSVLFPPGSGSTKGCPVAALTRRKHHCLSFSHSFPLYQLVRKERTVIWRGTEDWKKVSITQEELLWPLPSHCPKPGSTSLSAVTGSTVILGLCSGWHQTWLTVACLLLSLLEWQPIFTQQSQFSQPLGASFSL